MKVGIDWGGTKIEGIVLEPSTGNELLRKRVDAPKDNYVEIINKVCELINDISVNFDDFTIGIGMPGSLHPETGLVQVSNTKALEGKNVKNDLEKKLGYEVKIANDADCLAVSESIDGSGMNYDSVFAVIMGTGVGAGYTFRNQLVVGPNKLTGEWGQNPIPGPMDDYEKSVKRHCGRVGAIEVFLSGPGLENFYSFITNESKTSKDIVELFRNGDKVSKQIMDKYFERTARSFSSIVNILDPDVIVCGGGMSEINSIISFGSLVLATPLAHDYPPGTTVTATVAPSNSWPDIEDDPMDAPLVKQFTETKVKIGKLPRRKAEIEPFHIDFTDSVLAASGRQDEMDKKFLDVVFTWNNPFQVFLSNFYINYFIFLKYKVMNGSFFCTPGGKELFKGEN